MGVGGWLVGWLVGLHIKEKVKRERKGYGRKARQKNDISYKIPNEVKRGITSVTAKFNFWFGLVEVKLDKSGGSGALGLAGWR